MAESLATYIPESVTFLVAGFIPVTGFVDGTFIDVSKDLMPFTSVRTSDGMVARLYNNDQTYTITLTLHCMSESNNLLTKMWQVDEVTQRGKFPLLIKDNSGSDLLFSTSTWIEGLPTMTKSNGVEGRTWVFRSSQTVINFGGNGDPSSLLEDITNMAISAVPPLEGII